MKQVNLKYPESEKYFLKYYFKEGKEEKMEIISRNSISLSKKEFIGVYVEQKRIKKLLPKIKRIVKKEILIFDGISSKKLSEI